MVYTPATIRDTRKHLSRKHLQLIHFVWPWLLVKGAEEWWCQTTLPPKKVPPAKLCTGTYSGNSHVEVGKKLPPNYCTTWKVYCRYRESSINITPPARRSTLLVFLNDLIISLLGCVAYIFSNNVILLSIPPIGLIVCCSYCGRAPSLFVLLHDVITWHEISWSNPKMNSLQKSSSTSSSYLLPPIVTLPNPCWSRCCWWWWCLMSIWVVRCRSSHGRDEQISYCCS